MQPGQDKQLKLQFTIDQASFDKAKRAIAEITQEVTKLVAEMNRGGGLGGNLRGGGGMFGGASTASGGVNASHQTTTQQAKIGGFGQQLTQSLVAQRDLFKNLSSGSKDTLRSMADAVKDSIQTQTREVERLTQVLNKASAAYQQLKSSGAGVPGGQVLQQAALRDVAAAGGNLAGAQKQLRQLQGMEKEADGLLDPKKPSIWERMNKPVPAGTGWAALASGMMGGGGLGGMMGGIGQGFGQLLGGSSFLAGGVATGTVAALNLGASVADRWESTAARHYFAKNMQPYEMKAAQGALRAQGEAIRTGDVGRGWAARKVLEREEFRRLWSSNAAANRVDAALITGGYGAGTSAMAGRITDKYGKMTGGADNTNFGRSDMTVQQMNIQEMMMRLPADVQAQVQQQINSEVASDPRFQTTINAVRSQAMGRLAFQRQIASGTGNVIKTGADGRITLDPEGTIRGMTDWQRFQVQSMAAGFDPGESAAVKAQLMASAGRRYGGAFGAMRGAMAGGFNNAIDVFGAGAQFNSKDPMQFFHAAQSILGGGGMDVTAGSRLAGGIGSMLTSSGDFGGAGGMGVMRGLGAAAFTGSPGSDAWMASTVMQGMGALGKAHSGLEAGVAHLAYMRASGGNYNVSTALENLSPEMKLEIMRTGAVPDWLMKKMPIGSKPQQVLEMMMRAEGGKQSFMFADYLSNQGATPESTMIKQFQQSGHSLGQFIRTQIPKGMDLSKAGGRAWLHGMAETFGGAYAASHPNLSRRTAVGMVEAMISRDIGLRPDLKGGGAGWKLDKHSSEGVAAQDLAAEAQDQFEYENKNAAEIKKGIKARKENAQAVGGLADRLPSILEDLAGALETAATRIRESTAAPITKEMRGLAKDARTKKLGHNQ